MRVAAIALAVAAAILFLVFSCRAVPDARKAVEQLMELPPPSLDMLESAVLESTGPIPVGMMTVSEGCGHHRGFGATATFHAPNVTVPWEIVFHWPADHGVRLLLLALEGPQKPLLPGCSLVGQVQWVVDLGAVGGALMGGEPLPDGPRGDPGGFRLPIHSRLTLNLPAEAAGTHWLLQSLWWDGGSNVVLSPGWWVRVGRLP